MIKYLEIVFGGIFLNILFYLMYATAGIVEPFLWLKIFGKLYKPRYSSKKYYFLGGLGLYIIFFVKQMISLNLENDSINSFSMIFQIIYIFMMMKILYECKFRDRLISIGLLAVLSTAIDTVVLVLWVAWFKKDLNELIQFGFANASLTLLARMIEALILWIYLSKKGIKVIKALSNYKEVIPLVIINFALSIPSWVIYNNLELINNDIRIMQFIQMGTLLLFTSLTFYIIAIVNKRKRKEMNYLLKMKQMNMELEMYSEISELTEKLRLLRHDMRGHMGLIKALYDTKDFDKLGEYLGRVYKDVELTDDLVLLENKMVSILLTQKCKIARDKHINITSQVSVQNFGMADEDICSLLSNIMDNAIVAVEKQQTGDGYIELVIEQKENGYSIHCENSLHERLIMHKNQYITTKKDSGEHGLGISIIRNIAKKYGGVAKIYHDANAFTVDAFIPDVAKEAC